MRNPNRRGGRDRPPPLRSPGSSLLPGGGRHVILAAALLIPLFLPSLGSGQETAPRGSCIRCHRELDEDPLSRPAREFPETVHAEVDMSCTGCHGGDNAAESRSAAHQGFLGRPPRSRVPELCARCHSNAGFMGRYNPNLRVDQLARYRTSIHGQGLFQRGDMAVAICVDCHTAHEILPPDAERSTVHPQNVPETCGECHADESHMAAYDIPTDQLAEYRESIHFEALEEGDLSSPVCNDCHGNHGAVPPGYASVGRVCAECHFRTGEYFDGSPHDSLFARRELPGCATCHGNHRIEAPSDDMLALDGPGLCGGSGCHAPGDPGARAVTAMASVVDSLRGAFARADSILSAAEHAGMPVQEAQYELTQGRNALVSARAAVHTASLDSVRARADTGFVIARAGIERGREAFDELAFRRTGLAVSAAFILVLILGLVVKIRQLEKTST